MAIIDKKIKDAAARIVLGLGLQIAPADVSKIEQAVSDAAIATIAKETVGGKNRHDLPRALDRFGQTGAEGPAPSAIGRTAPGKLGGGKEAATEDGEAEASEPEIKERGGITQSINALRFRKELKQIDKQLKDLTKRKKLLAKDLQKQERALAPFERRLRLLGNTIRLLRIIKWICWALGALLSLFGVGEVIAAAALYLGRAIRVLHTQRIQIKKQMKPFRDRVKSARDKVVAVEKETQTLARRTIAIRNASLFERQTGGGTAAAPAA
jgi:hypothetical protein